ncbi:helix-turn-helix domain-containing protein [Clostridium oryzae]|uniref:HTH-type transcriptional activator Btr n=1 Tax=Clostridium oryzae TaxID=1450648 RepID=A0A1V4IZQ2_9CLOT|nr:helix-turn-helix domain-containing protein [Clostridium oryzae]OPJ64897.1 HTH-type transcriptional activator Btr [Clostridium oryzae]
MITRSESFDSNYDIEYLCKLFFEVFNMPVHFIDSKGSILFSFFYGNESNPLYHDKLTLFNSMFIASSTDCIPCIKTTAYGEDYLRIGLRCDNAFIGSFILGPSAANIPSSSDINNILKKNNLPSAFNGNLIRYFNSITIVETNKLVNLGMMIYYFLYNKKLDFSSFTSEESLSPKLSKIKYDYNATLIKNRQNVSFHHSQNREKSIIESVSQGNKEKLLKTINMPFDGEPGILAKNNPIRAEKNMTICTITIATRAAIKGGLDSEVAYTLSDSYIQALEEITDIKEINQFITSVLCDFTDKVHEAKASNYSKPIAICINYIFKHIYEVISLDGLCRQVSLSRNYLSNLFKKEVGLSLTEYIQEQKIEEAKKLLINSNYSILDIGTWLNFHDQSHFTRVFKQFAGTTPKKYRENRIRNE